MNSWLTLAPQAGDRRDPSFYQITVVGIQFTQDRVSLVHERYPRCGPATPERIKYRPVWRYPAKMQGSIRAGGKVAK
jgi:hypothetical protein